MPELEMDSMAFREREQLKTKVWPTTLLVVADVMSPTNMRPVLVDCDVT